MATTATKTATILARYAVKASGSIVYAVRNGENKEYCVTLNSNGTTGCVERATGEECKGHKYAHRAGHDCHHVTHCQTAEAARAAAPATLDDAEYARWKQEMGLDMPMSAQEVENIARYELAYVAA